MACEKILIVDDDEFIRDSLTVCLESENMTITSIDNGKDVMSLLDKKEFNLIILDLVLKDMDGFDILKEIRKKHARQPVIILSAKKEMYNKVLGLGLGANDYMTKPFDPPELIARVKAHIRTAKNYDNYNESDDRFVIYHDLNLDLKSMVLIKNNNEKKINYRLFKLLKYFMDNQGKVITKEQIYDNFWEDSYYDENTVKVYIRKLRQLIEDDPDNPRYLHTVWGVGYNFTFK